MEGKCSLKYSVTRQQQSLANIQHLDGDTLVHLKTSGIQNTEKTVKRRWTCLACCYTAVPRSWIININPAWRSVPQFPENSLSLQKSFLFFTVILMARVFFFTTFSVVQFLIWKSKLWEIFFIKSYFGIWLNHAKPDRFLIMKQVIYNERGDICLQSKEVCLPFFLKRKT